MAQKSAASPNHSTTAESLLDILKPEWAVSQQSIQTHSLIIEIALICGFANQSHFSRTFRSHVGMTPKNYRLQI